MESVFRLSADAVSATAKCVDLNGTVSVEYSANGRMATVKPSFRPDKELVFSDGIDGCTHMYEGESYSGSLLITRQLAFDPDHPLRARLRVRVRNLTGGNIRLGRMTLLDIRDPERIFTGTDCRDWIFWRQGRMKNDLPGACRLGDRGEAFTDICEAVPENKTADTDKRAAYRLVSDDVTILRSGKKGPASLLLGFMSGNDLLFETIGELDEARSLVGLRCSCLYNALLPDGAEAGSEWLRIDLTTDSFSALRSYAMDKALAGHALLRTPPSIFCTWYYYGFSITWEDMLTDLEQLYRRKIPLDVFQLDEGWSITLGDWRTNDRFPVPLTSIADEIRKRGFIPGIWTSPFIAHETAPVAIEHPEWMLRRSDGSLCLFPMNGTVYRVLDITIPEVMEWIRDLYVNLRECGFSYHKLDFTRAPVIEEDAVFHDPTIPVARAYRNAFEVIRGAIGEDAYLLVCGGLYDPLIGLADGQRAGSDVLSMWSDPYRQGGKAAPFTIKQTIFRCWMNAWWNNDPDALMIRRNTESERGNALTYGLLNDDEIKTSALNQYFGGGLVCATEPMKKISDDRLSVWRHVLPPVPVKTTAVDMFSGKRYPCVLDTEVMNGAWHTVTVINWGEEEWQPSLALNDELAYGLSPGCEYRVCEFFSGMITERVKYGDTLRLPAIAPHGSILLKIEKTDYSKLSVVASNAHFSFGAELNTLEIKDGALVFETDYRFDTPVRYVISLPKGAYCGSLPVGCAYFNGRLEIYIPKAGNYSIRVPIKFDN